MIKKTCKDCWFYIEKRESFDKKKNEFVQTHYCNHPLKDGQRVGLLEKTDACSQFKERQKTADTNFKKYGSLTVAGALAFLGGVALPPGTMEFVLFIAGIGGGIFSLLHVTEAYGKRGKKDGNQRNN